MKRVLVFDVHETLLDMRQAPQTSGGGQLERGGTAVGPAGGIRIVAAHVSDVQGALWAGCAAAFVERPGAVRKPLLERPDRVGTDLGEITESVIEIDR